MGAHDLGFRLEAKSGTSRINSSFHEGEGQGNLKHMHTFPDGESRVQLESKIQKE